MSVAKRRFSSGSVIGTPVAGRSAVTSCLRCTVIRGLPSRLAYQSPTGLANCSEVYERCDNALTWPQDSNKARTETI